MLVGACLLMVLGGRVPALAMELLDPLGVILGLLLGPPVFLLSLVLLEGPVRGPCTWCSVMERAPRAELARRRLVALLARAIYEEAFWRGTLQVLLIGLLPSLVAVAVVAGAFTARHVYLELVNRRPRGRARILELTAFALVLGLLYAVSGRLALVVVVHASRNLLLEVLTRSSRVRASSGERPA